MKTVFITGAAGFIGSNLATELLRRGYQVIGVDNFSQGFKRNIDPLLKGPNFKFYEADVCDGLAMQSISKGADIIAHLAAYKIPRYGGSLKTLVINTKGTENILEAAKANGCKVLFASTSDVYGKNPNLPFKEEDSDLLLGPSKVTRWNYAVSKIYDERLCLAFYEEHKVPVTIVRYFGGYGPNQHLTWWGGPQSVFIGCVLKGQPIPIHGNGRQTRTFIYISDLIEGTIAAIEREEATGQIFNIGTTEEISIVDLARIIWKIVKEGEPLIEYIPYETFSGNYEDVQRRIPDIAKAKQILSFEPKVSLEEGLRYTIEWQKRILEREE